MKHTTRAYFKRWWQQGRCDLIILASLNLARLHLKWARMDAHIWLHDQAHRLRLKLMSRAARRQHILRAFQNPPASLPQAMQDGLRDLARDMEDGKL